MHSYSLTPRIALAAGVALAALPRLLSGGDPADLRWMAIGLGVALLAVGIAWFASRTAPTEAIATIGDSAALGALAVGFPSPAFVALFVLAIAVYARRTAPLLAIAAPIGSYIVAMLVRLLVGVLPSAERGDAITSVILLIVAGFAVLAARQTSGGAVAETAGTSEPQAASDDLRNTLAREA
ncbi:MAG: hypothetical protein ABIP93_18855, partial [Gemmatimonadaceae bacterium]